MSWEFMGNEDDTHPITLTRMALSSFTTDTTME